MCSNAVFGKTFQNPFKHKDIRLVTDSEQFLKLVAKPNYSRTTHFSEDFAAVEMEKVRVNLDQPVYLGFTILELSKVYMA